MKKLRGILVVFGSVLVMSGPAMADLTPINPSGGEPDLLGIGGILDTLYGLQNLVRLDDGPLPGDQLWNNINGSAVARARYSGVNQTFGYIPGGAGGSFVPLFTVTSNGYNPGLSGDIPAAVSVFRPANQPGSWPVRSSLQSDNASGNDNMVSWLITGGLSAGHYVIAWEDQDLGDADYQDLVVELSGVQPVPVPGAVLLGAIGLSVAGVKLRKRTR